MTKQHPGVRSSYYRDRTYLCLTLQFPHPINARLSAPGPRGHIVAVARQAATRNQDPKRTIRGYRHFVDTLTDSTVSAVDVAK